MPRWSETLAYLLLWRHTDFSGGMLVPLSATEWLRDPVPFGWRGQAGRLLVPGKPNPPFSWSLFLKWAAVVVGLGVCAVGILLLWGIWDGQPVAAAFTGVGGATQVETALEASRFWLTPQYVVETGADASQQILSGQLNVPWPMTRRCCLPRRIRSDSSWLTQRLTTGGRSRHRPSLKLITIQTQRDVTESA